MGPRIAHVISTRGMGGAERFLAGLVAHGEAHGWTQVVLNPFATEAADDLAALCRPVAVEGRRCDRLRDLPSTRRWLGRQLRGFEPDVVHIVLFQALVVMGTVPKAPGTRRVVTNVFGDWVRTAPRGRWIRLADRWAGRRADHVAAISESVRDFLVSDYGYPPAKVTCIPLGWEGTPQPRRTGARPPTVVCVGGLRPEKGYDVLLSALSLVREDVPAVRLVVVGEGALRPSLEAQVAADGLGDTVEFLGSVPDIWPHLADADVFAIASRSEAFGIAIAEAMAAGLPVVAPDVGAVRELVRPGETGQTFPAGDPAALAAELVRLLRSPDLCARMGAAARETAEALRMDRAVERYFALFHDLYSRARADA